VIENAGYRTEYVSEPAYDGTAPADHARAAAPSLARAFRHHGVEAVVFDGNVPRDALILAAAERDLPFVWVRRGMWRDDPSLARFLELGRHCDAVIEPEEAAAGADAGVTAGARDGAVRVPPVVLLDRGEPLRRAEARAALGLPADGPCVLVQLGSGNNRDTEALLDPVLAAAERLGIHALVAEWLISERPVRRPHARYLSAFPNARYLHAFDFTVTAAGYNSFHELLHNGLPCVFLPNDDQRVDDQRARARFAEAQGAGVCVPPGGEPEVGRYMELMLDRSHRRLMARRARELCPTNGARAAAAAIEAVLARG
jgi:UDP:flavonoid glycosyltransferase YjiC (YdhE family)